MRTELERAKKELGLTDDAFTAVRMTRYASLLRRIFEAHTVYGAQGKQQLWLWQGFKPPVFSQHFEFDEVSQLITRLFAPNERVYLIAEDWNDKQDGNYWLYDGTVEAILAVLGETHQFEFYLAGPQLDWLLCYNHHDTLLATGQPLLQRLRKLEQETP